MSTKVAHIVGKLEENELWREACEIAEIAYATLHQFPQEEKWDTERKIRSSANDLMYYMAQAVANGLPSSSEYDWTNARKQLAALKTMYRFAGRQKMIELDPTFMVRIDTLLKRLDNVVDDAYKLTESYNKDDLEMWRKKYELWKATEREAQK